MNQQVDFSRSVSVRERKDMRALSLTDGYSSHCAFRDERDIGFVGDLSTGKNCEVHSKRQHNNVEPPSSRRQDRHSPNCSLPFWFRFCRSVPLMTARSDWYAVGRCTVNTV